MVYIETGNGLVVFHSKEGIRKGCLASWGNCDSACEAES